MRRAIVDLDTYRERVEAEVTEQIEATLDPRLADFVDWDRYAEACAEVDGFTVYSDSRTGEQYLA